MAKPKKRPAKPKKKSESRRRRMGLREDARQAQKHGVSPEAAEFEDDHGDDDERAPEGGLPSWIRDLREQRREEEEAESGSAAVDRPRAGGARPGKGRKDTVARAPRVRFEGKPERGGPGATSSASGRNAQEGKPYPGGEQPERKPAPTGPRRERIDRRDKPIDQMLDRLNQARVPLFKEHRAVMRELKSNPGNPEPHQFCTREFNQMRISDLEALSIARAFKREPHLIHRLPEVLARVEQEVRRLKTSQKRQNFNCPLLDGERCLVHQAAKPMGCLSFTGSTPSEAGWRALNTRNRLNERLVDREWELRAIPLMLAKYLDSDELEKVKIALRTSDSKSTRRGLASARDSGDKRPGKQAAAKAGRGRPGGRRGVRSAEAEERGGRSGRGDKKAGGGRGSGGNKSGGGRSGSRGRVR